MEIVTLEHRPRLHFKIERFGGSADDAIAEAAARFKGGAALVFVSGGNEVCSVGSHGVVMLR